MAVGGPGIGADARLRLQGTPPRAYSLTMVDDAPKDGDVPTIGGKLLDMRVRLPGGLHTKDAIEGRHARLEQSESSDSITDLPVTVSIPCIKGEVMQRLQEHAGREDDDDVRFEGDDRFELDGTPEVGAVALALVLLENVGRHGGTRMSLTTVRAVLDRLLPLLSPRELMAIDREAYRTMQWIGEALDPAMDDIEPPPPERHGPESHLELIQRAIRDQFDLEMEYFTGARNELTQRRITPDSVEAERYLHAYCHNRQHDRVFRLSRIGSLWPASGYVPPAAATPTTTRKTKDPGSQLSLLQDDGKDT